MKGKAYTQPQNLVLWENGYRSNMPDWPTARECAASSEMLFALKRARSMLLEVDRQVDHPELDSVIKTVADAIGRATGLDAEVEKLAAPTIYGTFKIPMPPGFGT